MNFVSLEINEEGISLKFSHAIIFRGGQHALGSFVWRGIWGCVLAGSWMVSLVVIVQATISSLVVVVVLCERSYSQEFFDLMEFIVVSFPVVVET